MEKFVRDFISIEDRIFRFRIGTILASSLSGFIAGLVAGTLLWLVLANLNNL